MRTSDRPRAAVFRASLWLAIPLLVLVGDIVIRAECDPLRELNKFDPVNWPMSVLLSIVGWGSLAAAAQNVTGWRRRAIVAVLTIPIALAICAGWHYRQTMFHDINSGIVAYVFFEPANAASLAASMVTVPFVVGTILVATLFFCALYFTRIQTSSLIRRAGFVAVVTTCVVMIGSRDLDVGLQSFYSSDLNVGLITTNTLLRLNKEGEWASLGQTQRPEVSVDTPLGEVPNILIFIGESLRPTNMSLFSHTRQTTPHMEALRARDPDGFVLFDRAYATSSMTVFGVLGILSGVYSGHERAFAESGPTLWQFSNALGGRSDVVASQMWSWVNMNVHFFADAPPTYFATGDELRLPLVNDTGVDDRLAAQALVQRMMSVGSTRPWLGVYQSNANHHPLLPSPSATWPIDSYLDRYDAAILTTDEAFGILVDGLDAHQLSEDTIIVLTSDHADFTPGGPPPPPAGRSTARDRAMGGRGSTCHPSVVRVPFFVYVPPKWRQRLDAQMDALRNNRDRVVSNVDIFATTLDLWGQSHHPHLDGASLLSPIPPDRVALCFGGASWSTWFPPSIGIATDRRYLHHRPEFDLPEAFDPSDREVVTFELRGTPLRAEDLAPFDDLGSMHQLVEQTLERIGTAQRR